MATEIIKVPDIGDIDSAEIIEVSVKVGDTIAEDDTLIVLESDKASMDVPAPMSGTITAMKVKEGDKVGEGDEILYLEVESAAEPAPAEAPTPAPAAEPAPAAASEATIQAIAVPDIGGDEGVEIIEIHVKVGDTITEDQEIVTLESDKASMEVPSPKAGEVVAIKVNVGDKVSEGDLLIDIRTAGAAPAAAPSAPAPSASTPAVASQVITVAVPDIGTDDEVEIIEVSVKAGDKLSADDPIVTLESDKASMEVPTPDAGEVVSVKVNVGDKVKEGSALIELKTEGKGTAAVPQSSVDSAPSEPLKQPPKAAAQEPSIPSVASAHEGDLTKPSKNVHAGPAVRRLAREFGVDLAYVPGTGPRGRILKDDVAGWVKKKLQEPAKVSGGVGLPEIPDQDFSKFGSVEVKELSRIQQITAQNMVRNWLNIPHVTIFEEADVTDLEAFRKSLAKEAEKRGTKLSSLAFVVKACAAAMQQFPQFNVSLKSDGKSFVQKHYVNIGIAVATPNGLIVPVIKDADKKSIWEIAEEIIDFAKRGRKGQVKSNEMQGGCFTVSSLGGLGSTSFTPIVNAPEVAILGLSNNQTKPHWDGEQFVPRNFLPMSLSFDHRAINGADGAMFTTFLKKALTDLRQLLM